MATFFAGCVWTILPSIVVTLDDDFWYLRSAIQTYQKGRPWTDEWLTPWAASTSVVTAILFAITGSFITAVHLPLAASAGLACAGMLSFLRQAEVGKGAASLMAMLILGTPTVLFMFVMYTSVAVFMGCLWWCLYLARRRSWVLFLLPWAVALAGRQTAVVWMALPAVELLRLALRKTGRAECRGDIFKLFAVLFAGGAWFALMQLTMNPTRAQSVVLGAVDPKLLVAMLPSVIMGMLFGTMGLGVASAWRIARGGGEFRAGISGWRILASLGAAGLAGFTMLWFTETALATHDCFRDPMTKWVLPALAAAMVGPLVLSPPRPDLGCLTAAAGAMGLVALYQATFDYYFVDILFFGIAAGFWGGASSTPSNASKDPSIPVKRPYARIVLGTALACAASVWTIRAWVRMTVDQNRAAALISMYEETLDAELIGTCEVGTAPFGYLGWIYMDCYNANLGEKPGSITGFLSYCDGWDGVKGTGVLMSYPKPLNKWRDLLPTRNNNALKSAEGRTVLRAKYPILGASEASFEIKQVRPETGDAPTHDMPCERVRFPLSDEGWRRFILEQPPL